ncbi:lysophospholipase NTE1 [Colletotrichum tofieldiae]|nr:lysophospholipase NTE1 [Colletotrichum tofieldiae]
MSSDISSAAHAVSESLSATMKASPDALPSAFTRAQEVVAAQGSSSWLGLFGRLILAILSLVSSILYWAIRIVTITIPTVLFTLFSTSWTVTMNATTLMVIMVAIISAVSWVVRYRILNMYSRLPPEPQRKEPDVDLFPDTHDEGKKSGLSSYLDEFLSAIKIFGYLERQVFHELTRSMQTRKLIAGETFNLEEEKGFCIVVDGLVEIFVKSGRNARAMDPDPCDSFEADSAYPGEEEDMSPHGQQRYQLLTEVRNGAPMSSLFSIMSLFTEDVKLRSTDDDTPEPTSGSAGLRTSPFPRNAGFRRMPSDPASSFPATPEFPESAEERPGVRIEEPPKRAATPNLPGSARIPPISLDHSGSARSNKRPPLQSRATSGSAHPDIIARATVDTTIAIIPASAFRRLTKVILSRFQRVTLATAYNYLGLTGEVLQTEKNMLSFTTCQLPNMLRGDALQRLKEKFDRERERVGGESESKGIALHNANAHRRRKSTSTLRKDAMIHSMATKERSFSQVATTMAPPRERASTHTSPGDLLANIQSARYGDHRPSGASSVHLDQVADALRHEGASPLAQRSFNPFTTQRHSRVSVDGRESLDEDNLFRQSILECMFKAIGLSSNGSVSREAESVEGSPRLFSYDQRRPRPGFGNNAFGLMGPFDASGDGDTESMTSGGFTLNTPPNAHILANDMKDDVEIVFFPKGSVLVEQGERNPGLYYVVDGFLDICTSKEDSSADILQSSSRTSLHTDYMGMDGSPGFSDNLDTKKRKPYRRSVSLIKPGGLAGYVGTVSSYRSFIDVVAKTDVYVGFLPRSALERIVDRYPIVLLTMAKRLTSLLPRLIMHIDFALDWEQVDAGQVLFHEGEESEAIHIVLNGRLRLVQDRKDGGVSVRAEFGQGESVGELEVLTESVRPGTLHAIRQTELVKFPRTLFNSLAQEHPNITIKISKIIASRMRNLVDDPSQLLSKEAGNTNTITKGSSSLNLRTVAILPVTSGVPVVEFGNRLMNALAQVGPANGATSLNQSAILNHLGKHAFNKMGKLKLSQYLADLEEKYGLVVYVADTNVNSPWTQTCITQADCILLVGLAEGSPKLASTSASCWG